MPKSVPYSEEAEKAVLGACLLDNDISLSLSLERLEPEDFYNPANKSIFECMAKIAGRGNVVDTITMSNELKKEETFEKIGGMAYLIKLTDDFTHTANIEYYIGIVRDKADLRKLITVCSDSLNEAYEDKKEAEEILETAEQNIFKINDNDNKTSLIHVREVTGAVYKEVEEINKSGIPKGIKTGYTALDNHFMGFQKGDMIVIGARPSMGKTAFALNLAWKTAVREPESVIAFFSLEMSKEKITERMLSQISNVELSKIKDGSLFENQSERKRFTDAQEQLSNMNIYLDESAALNVLKVKGKCRRLKQKQKRLDLVIIDYLQIMTGETKNDNEYQRVTKISGAIKALARELDCPVIILSQLSRQLTTRTVKMPQLSDLRESGAIEQDADIVMFLHRPAYYDDKDDPQEDETLANLNIAKNRNGQTGIVHLTWEQRCTKFDNRDYENPDILQTDNKTDIDKKLTEQHKKNDTEKNDGGLGF